MIVSGGSLLLMKRKNDPAKGEWWFPGGRIRKGESFEGALRREIREEAGIDIHIVKFVGAYNRIFPERHDIALVFLCKASSKDISINDEHSNFKFFPEPPPGLHPFLAKAISDSGWHFGQVD